MALGATPVWPWSKSKNPTPNCDRWLQAGTPGLRLWFFDHVQAGVAPNAIELHQILGFLASPR
jgi:hypothetical protein